jgi:ATP-dependent helicase HrpB
MMRLSRDDGHIAEARELFEASQSSDFYTLMRAYQFARNRGFSMDACRRYGIHAQTARQVDQTYGQLLDIAERQGMLPAVSEPGNAEEEVVKPGARRKEVVDDPLLRCLLAGFVDQLCVRRDQGTLDCDLTEGRSGVLMRESVVQNSQLLVVASIREVTGRGSGNLTLLGLASAVKREWVEEMFPQLVTSRVEHLYDRTHRRVAGVRLVRFQDLAVHHEHQRDVEPEASGRCLAEAYGKKYFELPLIDHDVKQFIARVNLVSAALPELDVPLLDGAALGRCLARAFAGITTVKEAQATPVREAIFGHLARGQRAWLDELAPASVTWPDGRKLKLLFALEGDGEDVGVVPELQLKLSECFRLLEHPRLCEGRVPVRFWLCTPEGKRLEATTDWPAFRAGPYVKLRPALQKKYPGLVWP